MCGHSFHPRHAKTACPGDPGFPPQARKDGVSRGPRVWRNGRVGFSFLVYTISKNALVGPYHYFLSAHMQKRQVQARFCVTWRKTRSKLPPQNLSMRASEYPRRSIASVIIGRSRTSRMPLARVGPPSKSVPIAT